jgi:hypothetical protein
METSTKIVVSEVFLNSSPKQPLSAEVYLKQLQESYAFSILFYFILTNSKIKTK